MVTYTFRKEDPNLDLLEVEINNLLPSKTLVYLRWDEELPDGETNVLRVVFETKLSSSELVLLQNLIGDL